MSAVIYTDLDKIRETGARYVAEGIPMLRAERQRDVDGTLAFLGAVRASTYATKLFPVGLQPKDAQLPAPARTVLEAMEQSRG